MNLRYGRKIIWKWQRIGWWLVHSGRIWFLEKDLIFLFVNHVKKNAFKIVEENIDNNYGKYNSSQKEKIDLYLEDHFHFNPSEEDGKICI